MTKTRLLAASFIASSIAGVAHAGVGDLVKVGETTQVAVFVDKSSIRRTGPLVRAALEWRWVNANEVAEKPGRMYRMERQVQVCNCENKSYAVAEGVRYSDERAVNAVDDYKNDETALAWSAAPPRTIRETVVVWVCANAPAAAAKKP